MKPKIGLRLDESLLAQLQKVAMKSGITLSDLVRKAILSYLTSLPYLSETEREVMVRANRKRERKLEMDLPIDMHDGAMKLITIWDSIEKEKANLKRIGILTEKDYDSWIKLLEANKKPLSKYEDGERLVEKLNMLIQKLKEEKSGKINS